MFLSTYKFAQVKGMRGMESGGGIWGRSSSF